MTVFDKYFERPAAIARHRSAPLAKERERFLTHLETTGTRRSAIRVEATYLLQVVNILGLHRLRDVTLEEVDRAADHWNRLRNQDKQYPTGQSGVRCFAQTARRFLRFEGKLKYPRLPQPFSQYLDDFVSVSRIPLSPRWRPAYHLRKSAARYRRPRIVASESPRSEDIDSTSQGNRSAPGSDRTIC